MWEFSMKIVVGLVVATCLLSAPEAVVVFPH